MAVESFDIGVAACVSVSNGRFGNETRQTVTVTSDTPTSVGIRVGLSAQLNKRKGFVIRAIDAQVELGGEDPANTMRRTSAAVAFGATAQAVIAMPRVYDANEGRLGYGPNWRTQWVWQVGDSSVPIGMLYAGSADADSQEWGGVVISAVELNREGLPGTQFQFRISTDSTRIRYMLSPKPQWQLFVSDRLEPGQVGEVRLRVAYPDGEPVVGLRVGLRMASTAAAFGNEKAYSTTITTGDDGVAKTSLHAVHSGATAVHVELADTRCAPEFFSPALQAVMPLNATTVNVAGQDCIVVPAVAPVPAVPARRIETPTFAWDAGANSQTMLDGDVEVAFSGAQPVVGAVVGFTSDRGAVPSPTRVAHGWYLATDAEGMPTARVYESGRAATAPAPYTPESEFVIQRRGAQIVYKMQGVIVRIARAKVLGEVSVAAALFGPDDFIFEWEELGGGGV